VGAPTWHHIPFLHLISRFSSQLYLHTHPRTNSDNGRLTVTVASAISLPLSLSR